MCNGLENSVQEIGIMKGSVEFVTLDQTLLTEDHIVEVLFVEDVSHLVRGVQLGSELVPIEVSWHWSFELIKSNQINLLNWIEVLQDFTYCINIIFSPPVDM